MADPRLYAEAITRGEAAVQHANARDDDLISAAASMALGVLHLDPYSAHRSLENTAQTRAEWERRLCNGETWDGTIVLPEEGTTPYPAPEEAMRRAERYLRAAAERRVEGTARARVLNALFAALDARHRLGDPPPEDVLLSTAREALQASAALKEPAAEVELLAKWQRTGQPIDRKFLSKALSVVPAEVMPQIGSVDTVSMLLMLAGILRKEGEGAEALQFLAKNESFFEVHAQGNARRQWLDEVLISLCAAYAPGFVLPALPVQDSFNEVQRMAEEQRWTAERFGAALLMLANHAGRAGEGLFGLELLTIVEEVQTFLPYAPLSIRNLRKVLWWSAAQAANLSVDNKISYLGQALLDSAALGDAHIAGLILTDLLEPVAAAESADLRSLADLLARLLLPLELLLGDKGSQQLQRVLGAALVRLVVTGGDRTTTHDLLRLAKGCRFSAMLASGAARRAHSPILLDEDPRVRTMRTRIDELLRDDPRAGLPPVRGERLDRLGELTLFTPQSREGISLSGNSTEEQLVNMQFRLDARLDELLTERTPWHHARDAKADALPGILGEQTVLLEQFLTSRGDAEFLVLFARTADDSRLGAAQLGSATVSQTYAGEGVTVTLGETAVRVRALRNEINKEPELGSTEMAETARAKLQNSKYLLGEISEVLPVWYAEANAISASCRTGRCTLLPHISCPRRNGRWQKTGS
ncbi:MAG TPA: hypothetical protein VGW39_14830 [Chthoniobacterales bacterium]|nr:hypothetical protein [Chthoniobacterales bacterium]